MPHRQGGEALSEENHKIQPETFIVVTHPRNPFSSGAVEKLVKGSAAGYREANPTTESDYILSRQS